MAEDEVSRLLRLAVELGGCWRMEHGVMPAVVLTLVEAEALSARLATEGATPDVLRVVEEAIAAYDDDADLSGGQVSELIEALRVAFGHTFGTGDE